MLSMNKRIEYMCIKWLVVMAIMFCWTVNATDQIKSNESPLEWKINHFKDGKTRFEYVHGDKTHFYEVKLTGIDIDGESIVLPKPLISFQKNQVTKQWLPYMKETWINSNENYRWSFEINRPDFISDSAKQITLKYDVDSDGEGGAVVPGDTSIKFDTSDFGKTLHEISNKKGGNVNLWGFSSRCHDAVSISGFPGKNQSVVFKLNNKSFPLFTQSHLTRRATRVIKKSFNDSIWHLAKFSEQNNVIQLAVPTEKVINDEIVESINIFQINKSSVNVIDSNQGSRAKTDIVKANEQEIFGFIKTAGNWHQLMMDSINLNRWEADRESGINHLEKINHALLSFGNLDVDYFFGKSLVVHGEYLYAISNGSEVSKIHILKHEGNQWITSKRRILSHYTR